MEQSKLANLIEKNEIFAGLKIGVQTNATEYFLKPVLFVILSRPVATSEDTGVMSLGEFTFYNLKTNSRYFHG